RRFAIRAFLPEDHQYIVGAVDEFDDQEGTAPLPQERAQLQELAEEYRNAISLLTDNPEDDSDWAEQSETFTFQVAALAGLETDAKQQLLATRSTRDRARALLELLPALLRLVRSRADVHVRARTNGQGGHGHDIVTDA